MCRVMFVGDDAPYRAGKDTWPICRGAPDVKSNIGNSREERKVTVCGYGDE